MDLLAQRYASPFLILDEFIKTKQLHDFTAEVINTIAEEKIQEREQKLYEYRLQVYLHRVFDMEFDEYLNLLDNPQGEAEEMSHEEIGNTINESKKILEGFIPS